MIVGQKPGSVAARAEFYVLLCIDKLPESVGIHVGIELISARFHFAAIFIVPPNTKPAGSILELNADYGRKKASS